MSDTNESRMTAPEVAKYFGVSTTTIYSWRDKGLLKPSFKSLSKREYYNREDIEKLYKEGFTGED